MRIVAVDDSAEFRERYEERLSQGPTRRVIAVAPAVDPNATGVVDHSPDLVLVDYQLNERQESGGFASYKGPTLAALLREKLPTTPILLVSRKGLMSPKRLAQVREIEGAFDDLVYKEDIFSAPTKFWRDVELLVAGYVTLKRGRKTREGLVRLLGATKDEADSLLAADPPLEVLQGVPWRVSAIARGIRHTVLLFPGVLYDALHAGVALGISPSGFSGVDVQRYLRRAKYVGPFGPPDGRWWKRRILEGGHRMLSRAAVDSASTLDFRIAWQKVMGTRLLPTRCVTSWRKPADCVCYVLKRPAALEYSLPYRPDNRPAIMDEARISFRAIRESNDYEEHLVAPEARDRLRAILLEG